MICCAQNTLNKDGYTIKHNSEIGTQPSSNDYVDLMEENEKLRKENECRKIKEMLMSNLL